MMSRSAPVVAANTCASCADVGIQQLQALAITGRAFQLGSEIVKHRTVRRTKRIRQCLNIKFGKSPARITVRRDDLTASQAIAQCRVCVRYPHDSLQGWLSYTVNNQRTNHIFQEVRK